MLSRRRRRLLAPVIFALAVTVGACGGDGKSGKAGKPTVVTAAGAGPADIQAKVDEFRNLLGPDNGGGPKGSPAGRREINWDKVPDPLARPNKLPADFFNAKTPPRARGALLTTPGTNVAVSASASNPTGTAPRFGDINPGYAGQFKTFSRERLFSPIGSNVVNLTFFVPGTSSPAVVRGFGAVYTDIDKRENTAFEYFDGAGKSLGKFAAPVSDRGLSFLGVAFRRPVVARVRIEYGSGKLGPADSASYDAAVMDDFIYGEPRPAAK